jgi:hypothetical protein
VVATSPCPLSRAFLDQEMVLSILVLICFESERIVVTAEYYPPRDVLSSVRLSANSASE